MKNIRRKLCIVIISMIIIICSCNVFKVFANTSDQLKKQQQENREEIEKAEAEQKIIKSQMSSIEKELDNLNSQISSCEGEIYNLNLDLQNANENIKSTEKELEKIERELTEKEELLKKRLVASYKNGETSYLDVLLNSDSLTSFLSNYFMLEKMTENDISLIEKVKNTKEHIKNSKLILEQNKQEVEEIKEKQELKKQELNNTKEQKNQTLDQLSSEEKSIQQNIDLMREEDTKIMNAIRDAEKVNNNISNVKEPATNPGGYICPVPVAYSTITTGLYYGPPSNAYHGAVDFGSHGISGQPVYAVKSGTVTLTQALNYSYGNYVIINHHDGTYTLYAHGQAGSICVSPGQKVEQGQQIMRVGSTGNSSGPHLHFEVRVAPGGYNNRVNPMNYLP